MCKLDLPECAMFLDTKTDLRIKENFSFKSCSSEATWKFNANLTHCWSGQWFMLNFCEPKMTESFVLVCQFVAGVSTPQQKLQLPCLWELREETNDRISFAVSFVSAVLWSVKNNPSDSSSTDLSRCQPTNLKYSEQYEKITSPGACRYSRSELRDRLPEKPDFRSHFGGGECMETILFPSVSVPSTVAQNARVRISEDNIARIFLGVKKQIHDCSRLRFSSHERHPCIPFPSQRLCE